MELATKVAKLAVQQVITGVWTAVGIKGADAFYGVVKDHFRQNGNQLSKALKNATQHAWLALETALSGPTLWDRCHTAMATGDQKALGNQIKAFLDSNPLPLSEGDAQEFRAHCLRDLRSARKAGLLKGDKVNLQELDPQAEVLARWADQPARQAAEWQAVEDLAQSLRIAGHAHLAQLIALRPPEGMPLLVVAVRFFFRHEVESNREMFQGIAFAQMERLAQKQEVGFAALANALEQQGQRLEELLSSVAEVVVETRDAVLDIQHELNGQRDDIRNLGTAVFQMLEQYKLQSRELRPSDSLMLQSEEERQLVKQLLGRYRALPQERKEQLPALLNGVGKLEIAAGDFNGAQQDFQTAARIATDPADQAEAHYHAHRAALEQCDWSDALQQLRQAVQLDPRRFEPFPMSKYVPQPILGASGLGATFLCHAVSRNHAPVVVKTILTDDLDREADEILAEASILRQIDHSGIIHVVTGGYMNAAQHAWPFLVLEYFDALPLPDYVQENGPLTLEELPSFVHQIAAAMQVVHARKILHRALKPSNVLLRKDGATLQVKLSDFGLAMRPRRTASPMPDAGNTPRSLLGCSLAGTRDFAAPEQSGLLKGRVGPHSDIYSFGKTCCFALFRSSWPQPKHWMNLPKPWLRLLQECLQEQPENRSVTFAEIVTRLETGQITGAPLTGKVQTPAAAQSAAPPAADSPASKDKKRWWPWS